MKFIKIWLNLSILLTVILLASSIFTFLEGQFYLNSAITTQGIVLKIENRSTDEDDLNYTLLVSYQLPDQTSYQFEGTTGSTFYRLGQNIGVRYDPANPQRAKLTHDQFWVLPLILLISALISGLAGLGWWASLKWLKQELGLSDHYRPIFATLTRLDTSKSE